MTVSWGGMLHNKSVFLLRSVILCLFVSFLFSVACTACGEAAVPFVRIDRDKLNGWNGKLANVRLLDIYVVDLRQESHVFVNEGIPLSWYGSHNWANEGMTLTEVEADEAKRFGAMIGKTIQAYTRKGNTPITRMEINVKSVMTEKELVESEGFKYLRIPIRPYLAPGERYRRFYILCK